MSEEKTGFDLASKLKPIRGGASYLDVDDRVQWLINDIEDGKFGENVAYEILTEPLGFDEVVGAMFKATVTILRQPDDGEGYRMPIVIRSATGHGSETAKDFGDFYEKAETKAVGRALNRLGYGTEGALLEAGLVVDTPRGGGMNKDAAQPRTIASHIADLYGVAESANIPYPALDKRVREKYGVKPEALTPEQSQEVITAIRSRVAAAPDDH